MKSLRCHPCKARRAPALAALLLTVMVTGCAAERTEGAATPAALTPEARLHLAEVAAEAGAGGFALAMYREAASHAPHSAEAQARYAQALTAAGDLAGARAVLSRALAELGPQPDLSLQRGRIALAEGEPAAALLDLDAVLAAHANDQRALTDSGIALDMLGRHQEAQARYRKALAAAPGSVAATNNLALSLMLDGDAAEAAGLLQEIAQRPDADQRTRDNLALALAASGRPSEQGKDDAGAQLAVLAAAVQGARK